MEKALFLQKYAGHLNEEQIRAIQTVNGPILLLAVPGSGKTTVLVNRIGYLLYCEGIEPENILTITYTVAATRDMAQRFQGIFGQEYNGRLEFRTINGICHKIIQQYGQMIGKAPFDLLTDEGLSGKIIMELLVQNLTEYPTENDCKTFRTLITYCKNMLFTDEEIRELGEKEKIPLLQVYRAYNEYLKQNRLMDYDDQLVYAYRMLKGSAKLLHYYRNLYSYICVDEAQDTSKVQHMIINLLAGPEGNLFMVGDEDQSIYGFRAAYPEALLYFEREHPGAEILVMDRNYRSDGEIVEIADAFISRNSLRHEKHLHSIRKNAGGVHRVELQNRSNQYGYLLKVAEECDRETAILYRDNESALPLIDLLERKGISYGIKAMDMTFFSHRIVNDIVDVIRFALDPGEVQRFLRIYYKFQTYLKKADAERLCRIADREGTDVLDNVEDMDGITDTVKGKCRAFRTHLRSMLKESPAKALNRIHHFMGYGEYLERNRLDDNKLYILKLLAYQENTLVDFLNRLNDLRELLSNKIRTGREMVTLSTIHSSKGLEYNRVFLLDVCDGVFPREIPASLQKLSVEEQKILEEERRLFYVGMTRAKEELVLFQCKDRASLFLKETEGNPLAFSRIRTKEEIQIPYAEEIVIGQRVEQPRYGEGIICDAEYDAYETPLRFTVRFENKEERKFQYPLAFQVGMKLKK